MEFIEHEEDGGEKPFDRFTDTTKLDAIDLDPDFILRVSLHRRGSYTARSPVESAFHVTSKTIARFVEIHVLATDHSPLQCAMFKTLEEASKWLGVSTDILEM
ncbi:MAG: hypothetical protein ABI540_06350 [Spartobacteria bacterium]